MGAQSYTIGKAISPFLSDWVTYFIKSVAIQKPKIYFLQVNDNGVISFGSRFNVRTPSSFPLGGTDKIIAPYWADVDTRGTGAIYYRQTTDTDLLARATSEIRAAFSNSQHVAIKNLLIATWNGVGYYDSNFDKVSHNHLPILLCANYQHALKMMQALHAINL